MTRLWRWRRRHAHDPLVCREFVELVTDYLEGTLRIHLVPGYLEDMRRVVASLQEAPEPPADAATREALTKAFRDLREPT